MMNDNEFPYKSTLFQSSSLKCFADRKPHREKDVVEFNLNYFQISDDEKELRTDKGNKPIHYTHSSFAFNELKNTPLLVKVKTGLYVISKKGLDFLDKHDGENEILPHLFKFLQFRCYKYANRAPEKLIFDSHFHVLSINSLDDLSDENGNYCYELSKSGIVDKGNIILGYDKKLKRFRYIFEVIDIKNNIFFIRKNIELSSGYSLGSSKLSNYLDNINFCSIFPDEFFEWYNDFLSSFPTYEIENSDELNYEKYNKFKRNKIFFGAPGTGKSHELNLQKEKLLGIYPENYERVTFHPDYSYANFVGTYKPVIENGSETISYKYVPGPFMRTLTKAINNKNKPYLLIIEEINRANVAAVFGDVFQLLDRDDKFNSEFPIDVTEDMIKYLEDEGIFDNKIQIPSNMFIWATMNSADQGVYLMDTAFKRRWDFEHISINNKDYLIEGIEFNLYDNNGNIIETINWNLLRKNINAFLLNKGINEDKLLGPFFISDIIKFKNSISDQEFIDIFKNKVLMYLYEDAAKQKRKSLFVKSYENCEYVSYSRLCNDFDKYGTKIFHNDVMLDENDNG